MGSAWRMRRESGLVISEGEDRARVVTTPVPRNTRTARLHGHPADREIASSSVTEIVLVSALGDDPVRYELGYGHDSSMPSTNILWSPTGTGLAWDAYCGEDKPLPVADLATGSTSAMKSGCLDEVAWSEDGARIACLLDDAVVVIPSRTRTQRVLIEDLPGLSAIQWMPTE